MKNESLLKLKQDQEIKINERIRLVFDTTPMLIDYWNKNHQIIDCNKYAMEFYGFKTKDEYLYPDPLSLPDYQSSGEPSLETRNNNLDIIFRDGYGKFEFEERKLNGDIIYLETEGIRVKDAESDDYLVITYSKDVTQFKKNELAMQLVQEELKYREKLLGGVNRAAETLLTASDSNRMSTLVKGISIIGNMLSVDRAQIWNQKEINGELCFVVQYNWASELGKQKEGIDFIYPYHKNPQWFDDTLLKGNNINGPITELPPEMTAFFKSFGVVSIAVLPMLIEGELVGFFAVHDCENSRSFSKDEMDVLTSAGLMFTSVFNHNMQRELAYTDALTGVRNRRYLLEEAENELQVCINNGTDFSLIMIDIDFFKTINDTYGHAVGDEVLQIFASRINYVLKKDTLFARYGGEEFAITLPGVGQENVLKIAERIRKNIEATLFHTAEIEIKVTVSLGVASKSGSDDTLFEIIKKADMALYEAKEAGRNAVVSFP
ncbi:MAG: diguanylate cyclase [Defluviitaleaceae bacterium]|nr:diguanylate cyclase [Defluviitaleaceae bacterium]